jgi:hydrogenase expression/formation protein HypE
MQIEECAVPVREDVRAACEILGLDPLGVACEGRFVALLPRRDAERAHATLRRHPPSSGAAIIGHVSAGQRGQVLLKSTIGALRILDMPSGEQLPRIC